MDEQQVSDKETRKAPNYNQQCLIAIARGMPENHPYRQLIHDQLIDAPMLTLEEFTQSDPDIPLFCCKGVFTGTGRIHPLTVPPRIHDFVNPWIWRNAMTIVRASSLSRADMCMLGNNVLPAVREDQRHDLAAVNRSLHAHGEAVDELAPGPVTAAANVLEAVA